jgi:quercetin dioxygenase-like cupin family protein
MKLAKIATACLILSTPLGLALAKDEAQERHGMVRNVEDLQFAQQPGLPECLQMAVESGDPANGPSVVALKLASGCEIPWHWHTPNEQVMMVRGSATVEMKGEAKAATLKPGGFSMLPSKHLHRFVCTNDCVLFASSDAKFDIHYVDAAGNEIAPSDALKKKTATEKAPDKKTK